MEIPVFNANIVDPGQTPHSVASDLDLHYFSSVPTTGYARRKWVNLHEKTQ